MDFQVRRPHSSTPRTMDFQVRRPPTLHSPYDGLPSPSTSNPPQPVRWTSKSVVPIPPHPVRWTSKSVVPIPPHPVRWTSKSVDLDSSTARTMDFQVRRPHSSVAILQRTGRTRNNKPTDLEVHRTAERDCPPYGFLQVTGFRRFG